MQTPHGGPGTVITTTYTYQYWDEAKQASIVKSAVNESAPNWAPGRAYLGYNANGHLRSHHDQVANLTTTYFNNAQGLVLKRERQQGASNVGRHFYYYADGRRVGDVSTDPSDNPRVSYAEQLARKNDAPVDRRTLYRTFRPVTSADFDQSYEPINEGYPGAAAGSYTVRGGETLQAIAQALWGDKSLWYLIAEVNGLRGDEALTAGQVLSIPNKVANVHNNAGTFRPYNAGEAIGQIDPTLPPAPPPPQRDKGCGGIGQILMIVVAVVVTVYTGGAASSALGAYFNVAAGSFAAAATTAAGYAAGAALGSIASQGVGIAAGVQDEFSWKAVGQAALAGGIGGAVSAWNPGGFAANSWQAAASSAAASTGINLALHGDWNWTAVLASAVGAGAGTAVAGAIAGTALGNALGEFGTKLAAGFAGGVAGGLAAGEKVRYDSVFISTLGAVIGSTIGEALRPQNSAQQTFRQREIAQQNAEVTVPAAGSGLRLGGGSTSGLSLRPDSIDDWSAQVDRDIRQAANRLATDTVGEGIDLAGVQSLMDNARSSPSVLLAANGNVPGVSQEFGGAAELSGPANYRLGDRRLAGERSDGVRAAVALTPDQAMAHRDKQPNVFTLQNLDALPTLKIQGSNDPALASVMSDLQGTRDPATGKWSVGLSADQIEARLQIAAQSRDVSVEAMRDSYEKFSELARRREQVGDQRSTVAGAYYVEGAAGDYRVPMLSMGTANGLPDNRRHMASIEQLRFGKLVGDMLGIDPVFGALLSPTGGIPGAGNDRVGSLAIAMAGGQDVVTMHGIAHDAAGYLRNYHDLGPGYHYVPGISLRILSTTNPYAGQVDGLSFFGNRLHPRVDQPYYAP